jgi:hypothetical protein
VDGSAVLKEAWRGVRDTNRRLGLASAAVLAVVGALVTWLATGQFNGSLLVGAVGGAALVFVGVFLWNLWLAPHQLLAAQIQQSKTTAPPKPRLPAEAKPLFDLYVKGQTLLNRTPDLWDGGVPASLAAAVNSWRNEVLAEMLKVGAGDFGNSPGSINEVPQVTTR